MFQFLNGSYGCSKSTESEIFDSSPKLWCVTENCNFWTRHLYASKRIWSHVYPIDKSWYSFRSAQMPSSKVTIFCDAPIPWIFLLIFDATLGVKNYSANYLYAHMSYIQCGENCNAHRKVIKKQGKLRKVIKIFTVKWLKMSKIQKRWFLSHQFSHYFLNFC